MRHRLIACAVITALLALPTRRVRAGGFEYAGAGSEALGRGGAVTARSDDPMVLAYNPAGLVELRGEQFLVDMNLALMHACMEPAGYYGWGVYNGGIPTVLRDPKGQTLNLKLGNPTAAGTPGSPEATYYTQALDPVCLKQNVVPIPEIAWTRRITENFGIGAGLIFPAQQPGGSWGGPEGVITSANGVPRPAATRYMLISENNLGVFPNVAAALRLTRQLRLGASFEWGVVAINNLTMAGALGGTTPTNDIVARVKVQDWFLPALNVSAHFVPIDALDVVLAFRWQDDIHRPGTIDLTTGTFSPTLVPYTTHAKITNLEQKMPWKLRAGVRYSDRLAPRAGGTGRREGDPSSAEVIHDPLQDERWDAEVDVEYELNARNDQQVLSYAPTQVIFEPNDPSRRPMTIDFPGDIFPKTIIQKQWQNQISIRAGGTVNVLPGMIGISAGAHYENRGVNPDYMQVDYWPLQRIGLHGGVIFRVARSVDLTASYAHIFQETIVVAAPPQQDGASISGCFNGTTTAGCLAPKGQIASIDKTVGVKQADGTGTQVLAEKSQGTPDGTARLQQNVTRFASGQPPYITNAGKYTSNFNVLAVGVNVHF